jgi:eukaryotic-like serine/threonine-protein kinase
MKRFFTLVLATLALVAVALLSAFIAMRLAIHGREVEVPTLTGLTVADATKLASRKGLNLNLENRFYSTDVPAGRILAQDPLPASRVRRDWVVRITESLGPQRVNVPDLAGESERAATVSIRRLTLDLGAVAHLAVPGDPGVVLTQTPPANAAGVDGPRVSLLVSDPDATPPPAYVMPSLVGLTWSAASARAAATGLHLVLTPDPSQAIPGPTQPAASSTPQPASTTQPPTPAAIPTPAAPTSYSQSFPAPRTSGTVAAQTPQPGRRVAKGDAVHVTLAAPSSSQ